MVVLVCGDRNWNDFSIIRRELASLPKNTTIIHGDCRGADKIAGYIAKQLGLQVKAFPADWQRYGRAAGPIRNRQMLEEGKPDLVLAFHSDLTKSKGTKDMVNKAKEAGVPVKVISS